MLVNISNNWQIKWNLAASYRNRRKKLMRKISEKEKEKSDTSVSEQNVCIIIINRLP